MRPTFCRLGLTIWLALCVAALAPGTSGAEDSLSFGRFGPVHLMRPAGPPDRVVLFVSGDGGWNLGVVDMARALAGLDALVVGIDITHYLRELAAAKEPCTYAAADFEALSQFVQKQLELPRYTPPVLVGYSSGATLVYAVLVQAPPGTFAGAMSLGFCPDLPLARPLCKGNGLASEPGPKGKGVSFLPAARLEAPWVAFQGTIDQVCDAGATETYVKQVPGADLVSLPKVGHGFSVQKNWLPQFREAFRGLPAVSGPGVGASAGTVADLPLVEVPAKGGGGETLAVLFSGDGGWAGLDREVAAGLAARGVPVVGWNSLQYFWTARTPEGAAADLTRVLRHYLAAWQAKDSVLIGYSFGADVLPFLVNRLPPDLLARVKRVALLGPAEQANFEFHLSDWIGGGQAPARPVVPEVGRIAGPEIVCLYGAGETDSACPRLDPTRVRVVAMQGKHHFGGDYRGLADEILRGVP